MPGQVALAAGWRAESTCDGSLNGASPAAGGTSVEPCTADVMQKNHMWLAHLCRVSPDECRAPGSLIKAGRSAGGAGVRSRGGRRRLGAPARPWGLRDAPPATPARAEWASSRVCGLAGLPICPPASLTEAPGFHGEGRAGPCRKDPGHVPDASVQFFSFFKG